MNKVILAGTITALVSTGALAGKGNRTPYEPTPDLTPRVEALEFEVEELATQVASLNTSVDSLEASNQEQDTRIQELEDALGYLQPTGGQSVVVVDSTDRVVGNPLNETDVFVKFEGYAAAYLMGFDRDTQSFTAAGGLQYDDTTCGKGGGQGYTVVGNSMPMVLYVQQDLQGDLQIPEPNVQPERVLMGSRMSGNTCRNDTYIGYQNVIPIVPVALNVEFPVRLEFR